MNMIKNKECGIETRKYTAESLFSVVQYRFGWFLGIETQMQGKLFFFFFFFFFVREKHKDVLFVAWLVDMPSCVFYLIFQYKFQCGCKSTLKSLCDMDSRTLNPAIWWNLNLIWIYLLNLFSPIVEFYIFYEQTFEFMLGAGNHSLWVLIQLAIMIHSNKEMLILSKYLEGSLMSKQILSVKNWNKSPEAFIITAD